MKKINFENATELLEQAHRDAEKEREIARELKALTDGRGRVINPSDALRVAELKATQMKNIAEKTARLENEIKPAYREFVDVVLAAKEDGTERVIREAMEALREACTVRAELAAKRKQAYTQYAILRKRVIGLDDNEARSCDVRPVFVLDKKFAVNPQEHINVEQVIKLALGV